MKTRISEHFFREEFACKGEHCCGHSAPVDSCLIEALEELRFLINKNLEEDLPLVIVSGFRCNIHNADVHGAEDSQHTKARAADIKPPHGITPGQLAAYAEEVHLFKYGGIGIYDGWVHVDVRGTKARWDERSEK